LSARALGAHINGIETFPFFAAAVLLAEFRQLPQSWIDELAIAFVILTVPGDPEDLNQLDGPTASLFILMKSSGSISPAGMPGGFGVGGPALSDGMSGSLP